MNYPRVALAALDAMVEQTGEAVFDEAGLGSEYQIHLTKDGAGRDFMRLVVERAEGVGGDRSPGLIREAGYQIKKQLLVTADLELTGYGTLPRSERKSQRIFDSRIQDEIV